MSNAYSGKILQVDLCEKKVHIKALDMEFAKKFLGAKGFGAKLLYDLVGPDIDPFSPKNVILYCTGPLTGTLAPCNRYCLVTKSPLTGIFSDSYAGGYFGQELKYAGYDILIIMGKAEKPVYLWIDDKDVEIKSAEHLWGLDTFETYNVLKKELGDDTVKISCIGPAGERKVRFALVDCDFHRHAGRCGTGAVMGSKNLKAIAIRGSGEVAVADPKGFKEAVLKAYEEISKSEDSKQYSRGGTPSFVHFSNDQGFYPTRNFKDGVFEGAEKISDIGQRENIWLKEYGCFACPIHCSKIGMIRRGPFKGIICDTVEYESTGLLGANCAIDNIESLAYANLLCDKLGLDTISTGNVIGFAMECFEKGILSKKDVDGLPLTFGNWKAQIEMIKKIAYRSGIGDILAEGVMRASKIIGKGAEDLAVHVKGMESPAWGPRGAPGMGLAYATADRGADHQKGWPIQYEVIGSSWPFGGPLPRFSTQGKAKVLKWEQDHLSALYSLCVCDFSRSGIKNDTYAMLVSTATGWNIDYMELLRYGERIWNLIRMFNVREGIGRKDDNLPKRFKEPLPSGPAKGHRFTDEDLEKMLNEYYSLRGWDQNGIPTKSKLVELELCELHTI
jgi:aldehyde:ferredoxin oxidoreductase